MTAQPALIVDLRCLQDENYRERGVGRHALGLLRHAREHSRFAASHRIIGIADPALPALGEGVRSLLDQVQPTGYVGDMAGCWFVQLSPMTHDPLFTARLASSPLCLRAAVVYDFIPFDFPARYLPDAQRRLDYNAQLAWLSGYDLFMPISRSSAKRLRDLLQIPERDVTVTGAPLDPAFERDAAAAHDRPLDGRHLLVIGGGDPRKNVECPIRAHAACAEMAAAGVPIVVTGSYAPHQVEAFRQLHRDGGGHPGRLRFPGHVGEAELLGLYREAFCVVTASRAEGFSLPVIEAMAAAVPSVASRIAAHRELVEDEALLFEPDDHEALAAILARAMRPEWRRAVVEQQAATWPRFRTAEVARLFWSAMQARADEDAAKSARGGSVAGAQRAQGSAGARRPRVALLSPVPPDRSGVADYTAACCAELALRVDLHVFTETENPAPIANTVISPLSELPMLSGEFDRVIGVMGNSHYHTRIFRLLMRYGGACICHDVRLVGFYAAILGWDHALATASAELGRPVERREVDGWLADESTLKATFLGELAAQCEPFMLHSPPVARIVAERFGTEPVCLPFSIYRAWAPEALLESRRQEARARLGIGDGEVLIATFGFVAETKAPGECIWALDLLRGWGIAARLVFVGASLMGDLAALLQLSAELGLEEHVRFLEDYVTEEIYRDYLLAADYGVQLRAYGMGAMSGALLDCISSGLPTVANQDMADATNAPGFVRRVPDKLAPVLVAEAIADLIAADGVVERDGAERRAFEARHNFGAYADQLCQAVGLPATMAD
ncbi:MAG: glycosyltransferase [Janthinobacterium lividum]